MSYSKYKDCLPEDTISKINTVLQSVGIVLNSLLYKRLDGIYSSIVYDKKNWWSTSGKGTTEHYCLASGYAEALEHLCNYCAYNYRDANDEAQTFGNFRRYSDEKLMNIAEAIKINDTIFSDLKESFSNDGSAFNLRDCEKCWSALIGSSDTTVVPFFSVNEKSVVYLPDEIVGRLSGSTGGGAGNTSHEALSHAFDEICERYTKREIYSKNLTPPSIPIEYIKSNSEDLYQTIQKIEQLGYRVIVKDASLGKRFPVIAVALIDIDKHSYMVKFGAHCSFNIALERCLTEMFQSYSLDSNAGNGHKTFHEFNENDNDNSSREGNWFTQLKDDSGAVPINFFLEKGSWDFVPWGVDIRYSNQAGVKYHLENFKRLGCKDVFIRNLSFLGFPVFKVYIPEYSSSHFTINDKIVGDFLAANEVLKQIFKNQIDNVNEYRDTLIDCFCKKSYIGSMILKNVEENLIEVCHASLLFEKDKDLSNLEKLSATNKYARAILLDFRLEQKGYTAAERESLFSSLFSSRLCDTVCCWRNENIFVSLIRFLNNNVNTESDSIPWERYDRQNISNTHIRFKETMRENMPNQHDTVSLINACYK